MQHQYDYKRYAVLYVDDEEMALKYFEKTFGGEFRIFTAPNALEGLKILEARGDEIGVLMTDQRMPGQKGVQLLERARQVKPKVVRMMITAYADFGVTVDAVNLGNIFRYVSKPLQVEDMRNTLRRAMEFFLLQKERDELMREKLSVLQSMIIADRVVSLGILASGLGQHLRNPIEAVRAFLNLSQRREGAESAAAQRMNDPNYWRDFHAQVLKQAGQIAQLVGEINGPSLADSIRAEVGVDTATVLGRAVTSVQPLFAAKGVALEAGAEPALPQVQAEERRLERLLTLLLQNELAIIPPGGRLSVTGNVLRTSDNSAAGVRFAICDNGPGIPAGAIRSVFDPFCVDSSETQDYGLRLLAVFLLAHHYGGSVQPLAEQDGAGFQIDIPLQALDPVAMATSSSEFITKVLMNDTLWERLLAGD